MKTIGNHRSRFALAALVALGLSAFAPAALSEAQKAGLSYYSTFDDPEKGIDPELGEGTWNTTEPSGKTPKFITVSGSNRALDVASYNAWTGDAGQQCLSLARRRSPLSSARRRAPPRRGSCSPLAKIRTAARVALRFGAAQRPARLR